MSGYAEHDTLARIPSEAEFLHKPFTPPALLKRVRAILESKKAL